MKIKKHNANLITAAPDMLNALMALHMYYKTAGDDNFLKFEKEVLIPCRQAIEKATNKTL